MMCKLPKKIKVGYATFKVRHVSKKSTNNKDMGECSFSEHVIRMFGAQTNTELTNTFLHECLHAINYIFGIQYKNAREEERLVNAMTNGLITVFRDNPELLTMLQHNLREPSR